jgi:hypothetical protein
VYDAAESGDFLRGASRPAHPRAINPTAAPCRANSRATARPTPPEAPVIANYLALSHLATSVRSTTNWSMACSRSVSSARRIADGWVVSVNQFGQV